jgi:hypothetical protein
MAQYENLFGVSRIPGIKRDSLQRTKNPEHIVVIRRNVFYALKLIQGEELPTWEAIAQHLDWILENTPAEAPPIGALTTLNRTPWAITRSYMGTLSQENAHSLDLLESALFVVCLDETIPTDPEAAIGNALYGDGRNRWFDKSIQLIFTASGQLAIHVEHTGLDGYTLTRFVWEVYQETSDEVRYLTLKRAVMAYVWRLFDCKKGEGVHRHLWALHTLARYQGDVLPDIFLDKAYTEFFSKSGITIVSGAGEMGREMICGSAWDHYAHDIRYVMEREKISFTVASKCWDTEKFIQILKQSLLELGKLMEQFYGNE